MQISHYATTVYWKQIHGDLQSSTSAQQTTVPHSISMSYSQVIPVFHLAPKRPVLNPAPDLTSHKERTHQLQPYTTPSHENSPDIDCRVLMRAEQPEHACSG